MVDVNVTAEALRLAYSAGPISPVRDLLPGGDIDMAYAVQECNTMFWEKHGRQIVGCKIGLTSPAVQKQLGVDRPDFGVLFGDMMIREDEIIAPSRVLQPRVEVEVAFVLDRDLDRTALTIGDVMRSTAYVVPAIEIVGSRVRNWDIKIVDTIADNASSGLFVLGGPARRIDGLDLRACEMTLKRGEVTVSSGSGAACLGNPLNAVAWLAAELVRRGRPLRAGNVVLSGALGPMVAASPGDLFEGHVRGLGSVSTRFAQQ